MSTIKSLSVGNGDMFYIKHNTDNFTIIDCHMPDEDQERIIKEIKHAHLGKSITRFISTHPDQDHINGLKHLDDNIDIVNFYCVKNNVVKEDETDDFKHYCKLRDHDKKAFYIERGSKRKWMNLSCEERDSSGIHILWPIMNDENFKSALKIAEDGGSPNNISAVIRYSVEGGASVMWMGDLETDFLDSIKEVITWPKTDILFAPHHGRDSGKVPEYILKKIDPKVIILGEAPSDNLNYYTNYNTITQNTAGDITLDCVQGKVHVYVSNEDYSVDFLTEEYEVGEDTYIGTLAV